MRTNITFTVPGAFQSSYAAEAWLRERGFSFGPSQADGPQAVWYGDCHISKWRNLSRKERAECIAGVGGAAAGCGDGRARVRCVSPNPPAFVP